MEIWMLDQWQQLKTFANSCQDSLIKEEEIIVSMLINLHSSHARCMGPHSEDIDGESTHVAVTVIANRRIGLSGFKGVTMAMKDH
jgi:hypothetical protein